MIGHFRSKRPLYSLSFQDMVNKIDEIIDAVNKLENHTDHTLVLGSHPDHIDHIDL